MNFGALIAVWFWGTLAAVVAWLLIDGWIEERRWQRDEDRQIRGSRLTAFDPIGDLADSLDEWFPASGDPLEDLYEAPCAPDPRRIA